MIKDTSIKDFLNELKSAAPTPGGGGVAALNSANGVALIMMVANLTVKSEKYSEWHDGCNSVLSEAEGLLEALTDAIDEDAKAFQQYKASVAATEVPLKVMEKSVRALELDASILGKSNPNVESDLFVAARSLQSGILSAKYSVDANLAGIRKEKPELANEYETKAKELCDRCNSLMEKIF